ncbi:hypothetical protein F4804DRAFT_296135 [Jackrogersella minutella]|nr:hypothetical protein F4804DRAFT_296135 [Jackrogersella minutella]
MEAPARSSAAQLESGSVSGPGSGFGHSPTPTRIPSPARPPVNLELYYPNGLPRSIDGLKSNGANGTRPASPATASPRAATPVHPVAPSPTAVTTTLLPRPLPAPIYTTPPVPPQLKPIVMSTPSISQPSPPIQERQPLRRQSSMNSSHKISIVDPPGAYSRSQSSSQSQPSHQGFPSPKREHQLENPKFLDDLSRLTHAMQQSVSAAVRRAIRDNWQKCLLGSEFHHAFLLNAVIHHSNGVIVRRSIKDFGVRMVAEAKHEIIAHLETPDLDELADEILAKASDFFLDSALEKRLKTIDARSLINALARAERLGYENHDIIEDNRKKESTFNPSPTLFDPSPIPVSAGPSPKPQHRSSQGSLQQGRGPPPVLQCPLCWRKFDSTQPYEYHVQKQVCTKPPPGKEGFPFSCKHCGAGFITKVGQQYHVANHVCGEHGIMPATPKGPMNTGSPIILSSGNNSPVQSSFSLPYPSRTQHPVPIPSQHAITPIRPRGSAIGTPRSMSKDHDPYAHLTSATKTRLEQELRQAELAYTFRFEEARTIEDLAQRQVKVEGLQNSFSTKQSIIRKKYGVRLRNRRTKAEIDNERQRMGWKHGGQNQPDGTPSAKRQRTDDGPSQLSPLEAPSGGDPEPPGNHLTVSDMNAGLGGSSATAAMTDPTLPKSSSVSSSSQHSQLQELAESSLSSLLEKNTHAPDEPAQNSLSSLQKKGYRVSSHLSHSNHVSPTDTTMEESTPQPSNSASAPIIVDDNEDSTDTDSDGDIPASMPPRKASNTPSKGLSG